MTEAAVAPSTTREVDVARFALVASEALASSLDVDETLRTVTRLAVPGFCDLCTLKLVAPGNALRVVAATGKKPDEEASVLGLEREFSLQGTGAYGVDPSNSRHVAALATGKAQLSNDVPASYAWVVKNGLAMHPRLLEKWRVSIELLGLRASISQPMVAHGRVLGMIDFLMTDSGRTFTPEDLELSNRLGVLAALALENARLYRESLDHSRSRETFVAVASHELRQPIHVLNMQLAMLRTEKGGGKREDAIERQLGQMRRLVDDLLDVARLGAGTMSLKYDEVDLAALASEVTSQLTPEAERRKVTLTLDTPASLPCFTDRDRVGQILSNLVSNAVKYGENRPVTVQLVEDGASAILSVSDRGPGIPASARESIFEKFRRQPEHQALPEGAGVGLWIAREIAHALGGSIRVEDHEPGASFVVTLARDARTTTRKA